MRPEIRPWLPGECEGIRLRGARAPGLVSRAPGRLRDPPWGYYGPCARSSLTCRFDHRTRNARTGVGRKLKEHSPKPQVERREARTRDRKRVPHISRCAQGGFAGRPKGSRRPLRLPALRFPFGEGKKARARAPLTSGQRSVG